MRSTWGFIMFLIVFLSLYGGMNTYVLLRLAGLFAVKHKFYIFLLAVFMTFSLVGATILEAHVGNSFTRCLYLAATTWMGMLWLLFCTLLVYEIVRWVVPIPKQWAGKIIVGFVILLTVYAAFNARRLEVRYLSIPAPVKLKIAQLSDIHLGSISPADFRRIIDKTNQLSPDVVLITGDLLDNFNARTQTAVHYLDRLQAPTYFVTGNHEGYVGLERVTKLLRDTRIKVLRNEVAHFRGIRLVGIDDSFNPSYPNQILDTLKIDPDKYTILLYHRPEAIEHIDHHNEIDLVLTGHTHNGQIFPFNLVVKLFCRYLQGLHRLDGTWLYVSVGTGNWGPPLRLGSRRTITVFQLGSNVDKSKISVP